MPQAKTQPEFAAYNATVSQPNPVEEEKAVADFLQKFPQSELTPLLYRDLMQKYQQQNNAPKTIETGRKLLAVDARNPLALVLTATTLAESTRDTDLDRDAKYDEATKDATLALDTTSTDLLLPPSVTPEQEKQLKNVLLAMAHATLGYIAMNKSDFAGAEQHLVSAIQLNQAEPDAMNYLRLAIAQDQQKKYADAMTNAGKALDLATAQNNAQVVQLARNEKDRLSKLVQ